MDRNRHRHRAWLAAAAWLAAGLAAPALGPHELVLLVNGNSPRSVEVANHYVRLRRVPPSNVVFLSLPDSVLAPAAEISAADFTRRIWEPANRAIDERGIRDHVLAWVYSVDFPVRIAGDPPVSLTGLTFVRNRLPPAEVIQKGTQLSPLFRGPDKQDGPVGATLSLEQFAVALGTNMPLPAMMLGHAGARGLTTDEIEACLRRGAASDASSPKGTIYLCVNEDVRSKCRDWQFAAAVEELKQIGRTAAISPSLPARGGPVAGLLTGLSMLEVTDAGALLPGAIASHLTSFGAYFEDPKMTVLTEWLRAGAVASDGTVTEPMAIWTKFPNARLFAHYARGCTTLESYAQAVRSPLQLLLVGEPLARPWALRSSMIVVQTDDGSDAGKAAFHADLVPPQGAPPDYFFLVDGRSAGGGASPDFELPAGKLSDGYHELQVAAYQQGPVRHQAAASCGFTLNRKGRAARLEGLAAGAKVDARRPFKVTIAAEGKPGRLAVACGARLVAAGPDAVVDPRQLGKGPVTLQAVAFYEDGDEVRGEPVPVDVEDLDQAPLIAGLSVETNAAGRRLAAKVSDPDGDRVQLAWFQRVGQDEVVLGSYTGKYDLAVLDGAPLAAVSEICAEVSVPHAFNTPVPLVDQMAALVFDYRDDRHFAYFGLMGDSSAWAVGECRDGKLVPLAARGAPIRPGRSYRISVRRAKEGGVECRVDGELVLTSRDVHFGEGPLALVARGSPATFRGPAVSPPSYPAGAWTVSNSVVSAAATASGRLVLRASDGFQEAWKALELAGPDPLGHR